MPLSSQCPMPNANANEIHYKGLHFFDTQKERAASTTALSRFHYKLYLTKLKPHSNILTNP